MKREPSLRTALIAVVAVLLSVCAKAAIADSDGIGYDSVGSAFEALKNKKDAKMAEQHGWLLVQENADKLITIWTFTPQGHPAHPSVVRRRVFEANGTVNLAMDVLCEAQKVNCDGLVAEFQEITEQIRESFNKR